MESLIIIGDGGHSKVIRDIIEAQNKYKLIGILDDKYINIEKRNGLYYGPVKDYRRFLDQILFFIAIGDNNSRKKIAQELSLSDQQYACLVHPSSIISKSVKLDAGAAVMPNCVVNADTKIGKHTILNTAAVIEHDCVIEDYAHISPNATLTGGVRIGEGVHIGASAAIVPKTSIGEWTVIGAGAAVIHSISSFSLAAGVPARIKNKALGGV
ncbi:acetyltransferase [Metabacillus sp. GX 13764]|uniref:acetyltransferase n=1 Tax=Metabacillus kandeliae TaxID=2900151 RepID=UPI001E4B98EE|nr:acetyltransferase [Metabacillus kandeliae]MCD7033147.1 acetyltransferase [Metabacillus kandeliae]